MDTRSISRALSGKGKLRSELRVKAAAMTRAERTAASASITDRVISLPEWQDAESVFLYWNTETEPDTAVLISAALAAGKTVLLPRCVSGTEMEAVPWSQDTAMKKSSFGIPEPEGPAWPGTPDLVIVPCVSAAPDGTRLGHGAGYYDRWLSRYSGALVCLCFDRLLSPSLPADETDIPIPCVVTESRVFYACPSGCVSPAHSAAGFPPQPASPSHPSSAPEPHTSNERRQ